MVELKKEMTISWTLQEEENSGLAGVPAMQDELAKASLAGEEITGNAFVDQTGDIFIPELDSRTQTQLVYLPEQIFSPIDGKKDINSNVQGSSKARRRRERRRLSEYERKRVKRQESQKKENENKNGKSEALSDTD